MHSSTTPTEWPMPCYMNAWRIFRGASNENYVTAQHIVACDRWPRDQSISIVDVGCGDGLLVSQIATLSPADIKAIRLIEPNTEFLSQAAKNCESEAPYIESINTTFRNSGDTCFKDASVVIAAHLVYLLPDGELELMLERLPVDVPMYVVLDHHDSIFSKLWAITASKYLERAIHARQLIENLPSNIWKIAATTLNSEIGNPETYNKKVSDHLYSLLCYTDVRDHPTEELDRIKSIVRRHMVAGGKVRCHSICYELVKLDT